MAKSRLPLIISLIVLVLAVGRESQAVIYMYMNETGVPTFTDDMQKIPDQYRTQAVIVTGGNDYDAYTEQEKARLVAAERIRQEQPSAAPIKIEEPLTVRLIRSGFAVGIFIALLFVVSHIDDLKERAQALSRIRSVLVVLLLSFLGFTHARDVMGLFGKISDTLPNPVASIREKSAEQGKKAAEAYKSMDKILDLQAQGAESQLRETGRKIDDAERGK